MGFWGELVDVYINKRDGSASWCAEAYRTEIEPVIASRIDFVALEAASAEIAGNELPWTIFAYPTSVAGNYRLPPDIDVRMLLAEFQVRKIAIAVWSTLTYPRRRILFARDKIESESNRQSRN